MIANDSASSADASRPSDPGIPTSHASRNLSTGAGALAGAAAGAIAGPVGAVAGGAIGALAGFVAGAIAENTRAAEEARDHVLDKEIGVDGNEIGLPPGMSPPVPTLDDDARE